MSERLTTEELEDIQKAVDDPMAGELIYVYKEFLRKLIAAAARAASGLTLLTAEQREWIERYTDFKTDASPITKAMRAALSAIDRYAAENARLKQQIGGVQGALADAGGDVLCFREDGYYGASVRQVVEERDKLKEQLDALQKYDDELTRCEKALEHWPLASGCNGHLQVAGHIERILAVLADKERECEANDALILRLSKMCGEEIGRFLATRGDGGGK